MEWKEAYSVGIDQIDKEHQIMVEYVTGVETQMARHAEPSEIEAAIGRLASFAVTHFGFEETLMQIHEYADIEDHIEGHRRFLKELAAIQEQVTSGSMPDDVVRFLQTWLERHFLADDKIYAGSLSQKDKERVRKYVPS